MSSRQVRFANAAVPPLSPASTASTDLSPGPWTPPTLPIPLPGAKQHPSSFTPSPPHHRQLHRLLEYRPNIKTQPLYWIDVTETPPVLPASTNMSSSTKHCHSSLARPLPDVEPATTPPTKSMVLITDLLPWLIEITPPPGRTQYPYVTVPDVLNGIYGFLRMQVTQKEFDSLPRRTQDSTAAAFHARCRSIRDPVEKERQNKHGLRRIDLLPAHSFSGLSKAKENRAVVKGKRPEDVWILHLQTDS